MRYVAWHWREIEKLEEEIQRLERELSLERWKKRLCAAACLGTLAAMMIDIGYRLGGGH